MPHTPASDILARFTVLDLTRVRSGPTCTRQLGDWGANVIKIEQPSALEADGALGAPRHTPDFQNLQRNKRSLTLNLKEPDGRDIFMRLAEKADVIVENFRPDVKKRLGIDYDAVNAVNPRIVYASISGFGQEGPYAKRPGFDQIAQGMGGLMSITGEPGKGPMRVGIPVSDLCGGIFCAMGVLLALLGREETGKGQWVQTSLVQSMIFMLDFQAARWLMNGEVPPQTGNRHPTGTPTGIVKTRDGYINLASSGAAMWKKLCALMAFDDWADNPDFADTKGRFKNREKIFARLDETMKDQDSTYWIEKLNDAGIPAGPIYSIDQTFADPQVRQLGMSQSVVSQALGEINLVAQPINMNKSSSTLKVSAPERGEHTDEILKDLGLSSGEIDDLRTRTII
ncbi:MAG: CoA transferase [Rhodospirillales bacterium]